MTEERKNIFTFGRN